MLKILAQMGLLFGGLGLLSSYLDPEVANEAGEMLRKVSGFVRQSDTAGSDPAAVMTEKVADTIQNSAGKQAGADSRPTENAVAGRAFYNRLPSDCLGEKNIELEGYVSCDQGRRPHRNQ